ncbi:LacI family transcriptional regulator [Bifidobacterium primatium]|uniref:LacI family transcriptional regulator n=1 Tax=Bifidobacterium primatium TaxID=2045438 RepID=A0A2M9HAY2_9BIFI|nr:LacI family DNA-binding transcriptional regulator [Bifidobacterium primatium]PJM73968.1 LacI family transcriptional regulator [Bifidobacterium primatium]
MSSKRVSIFEVARAAGVSHQTVSRVINHSPNVSPTTRAKVQATIDELGYRPSGAARALATQRTRTIALIAGGMSYHGPLSTISSIEAMARKHGLYVSISIMNDHEYTQKAFEEVANACLDQGVEAFVFVAPTEPMVEAALSARLKVPRVILTSSHGSSDVDIEEIIAKDPTTVCLGVDQWSAIRSIVDHLAEQGHRRAIYFAGPQDWRDAATRRLAWEKESAAAGIESRTLEVGDWSAQSAYDLFERYLAGLDDPKTQLPTAIVAANDLQATGIRRSLYEHGFYVPKDVSLVGFDDMPGVDNAIPPLTTIRPDFSALGVAAMRTLFSLLGTKGETTAAPKLDLPRHHGVATIVAPLIVRKSTAAPTR